MSEYNWGWEPPLPYLGAIASSKDKAGTSASAGL